MTIFELVVRMAKVCSGKSLGEGLAFRPVGAADEDLQRIWIDVFCLFHEVRAEGQRNTHLCFERLIESFRGLNFVCGSIFAADDGENAFSVCRQRQIPVGLDWSGLLGDGCGGVCGSGFAAVVG